MVAASSGRGRRMAPRSEALAGCRDFDRRTAERPSLPEEVRGPARLATALAVLLLPLSVRDVTRDCSSSRLAGPHPPRARRLARVARLAGVARRRGSVAGRRPPPAAERGPVPVARRHSSDLITVLDAHGTVTYQSPSVERVLGYRVEEIEGRASPPARRVRPAAAGADPRRRRRGLRGRRLRDARHRVLASGIATAPGSSSRSSTPTCCRTSTSAASS